MVRAFFPPSLTDPARSASGYPGHCPLPATGSRCRCASRRRPLAPLVLTRPPPSRLAMLKAPRHPPTVYFDATSRWRASYAIRSGLRLAPALKKGPPQVHTPTRKAPATKAHPTMSSRRAAFLGLPTVQAQCKADRILPVRRTRHRIRLGFLPSHLFRVPKTPPEFNEVFPLPSVILIFTSEAKNRAVLQPFHFIKEPYSNRVPFSP